MHFTCWELVVKMCACFHSQCLYTKTTNTGKKPFLYPLLSQLDTYAAKYALINKCMLANLVSGTQIICLERIGIVV